MAKPEHIKYRCPYWFRHTASMLYPVVSLSFVLDACSLMHQLKNSNFNLYLSHLLTPCTPALLLLLLREEAEASLSIANTLWRV